MNARQRAYARFCEENEDYIRLVANEYCMVWGNAVALVLQERNDRWQALFQEELAREDLTAR